MTRRVRVLLSSRIFAPEPSAASARLASLVEALHSRGCEVNVLTSHPPRHMAGLPARVHAVVRRWPVLRDRSGYVRGYLPYLSFDLPLLFRILFGPRADVGITEPPPTTGVVVRLASALRRRRYAYYAADIWSDASATVGASAPVLRAVRAMEKFALRGAAVVLAVSEGVRERVISLAPEVPVVVVGHGVDTEVFSSDGALPEQPADVVYVGTASEWHGAELAMAALIDVMANDAAVTAAFIGQGSAWPALREMVHTHGLTDRIRFCDPVPAEVAAQWLRGAKVSLATLAPGQGYDFAVPTKIYSSLACGTPVVYAGPEPVRAIISNNRLGWGVAYDRAAVAGAIRTALSVGNGRGDASRIRDWVSSHVSAKAVGASAAEAILAAIRASGRSGARP